MNSEESILGIMINNNDLIGEILTLINEEMFTVQQHKKVFNNIMALQKRGSAIDITTIDCIESSEVAIYMQSMASRNSYQYHCEQIEKASVANKMREAGREIMSLGTDAMDIDEIIAKSQSAVMNVHKVRSSAINSLSEVLDVSIDKLKKAKAGEISGFSWGFPDLDDRGRLDAGIVNVIGGESGGGKTILAIDVALAAARQGKNVLFLSLEMSDNRLVDRMLSSVSGVDLWKLRNGKIGYQDEQKINEGYKILKSLGDKIHIVDEGISSIEKMQNVINQRHVKDPLDLVIIDFIQITEGDPKESRAEQLNKIVYTAKEMSKRYNCCFILLSQLNRASAMTGDKVPRLHDLKDSSAIGNVADMVLVIKRNDVEPDQPQTADIHIVKNRDGATQKVSVLFLPDTVTFKPLENII